MADQFGDDSWDFDPTALHDNDAFKFELGVQLREHTIIAIDCHPANILRKVLVAIPGYDPLNDQDDTNNNSRRPEAQGDVPKGKKVISQLEYLIEAIISIFRHNILTAPDKRFAVMFYNLPISDEQPDGIRVLKRDTKEGEKMLSFLSKDFILQLMAVKTKEDFIKKYGICPWLEGTTPFSAVINQLKRIFHQDIPANFPSAKMTRDVWLFTPFKDPARAPYEVFRRRVRDNQTLRAKFRGVERDLAFVRGEWQKDTTATKRAVDQDPFNYQIFPLFSALPGLYNDNELSSEDPGFAFYNSLEFRTESSIFNNQDLRSTLSAYLTFTKDGINDVFKQKNALAEIQAKPMGSLERKRLEAQKLKEEKRLRDLLDSQGGPQLNQNSIDSYGNDTQTQGGRSMGSTQGDSQFSYQQGGQNSMGSHGIGVNDLVSLGDGGASTYSYTNDTHSAGGSVYGGQNSLGSISNEGLEYPIVTGTQLEKLAVERNRFAPEPLIMELGLFQSDLPWLKKSLVSTIGGAARSKQDLKQEQIKMENENARKMGDDDDNGTILPTPSITTLLAHFQDTLPVEDRTQRNKQSRQLNWDGVFFSSIFPDIDIESSIEQARTAINDMVTQGVVRDIKKRSLATVPLFLPRNPWSTDRCTPSNSVYLGLDIFTQFVETKPAQSNDVKLDPVNHSLVVTKTTDVSSTGEVLTKDDKTNYVPVGGKEVLFFTKEDVAKVKQFGPGSLRIIGFKEYDGTMKDLVTRILPVNENVQKPYFCTPNELKYPGSSALCADLIQMCYVTHRVILAQFIPKAGMIPRVVWMLPTIETIDNPQDYLTGDSEMNISHYSGFQLIQVPFAEDLRDIETFPSTRTENQLPDNVAEALRHVIDEYQFTSKKTRNGDYLRQQNCLFDETMLPPLHKLEIRNAILEEKALGIPFMNPTDKLTLGPNMQHVDEAVEQFNELLREAYPGLGEEKVKLPRGKKAAAAAGGDDDEVKPKTATKRTAAKAKNEDEGLVADEKPKRAPRGKKAAAAMEDGGAADMDEEEAKPKKTTARGKKTKVEDDAEMKDEVVAPKKPARGKAAAKKKAKDSDEESEFEESEDEKPKKKAAPRGKAAVKKEVVEDEQPKARTTSRVKSRFFDLSDDDNDAEDESEEEKPKKKGRKTKAQMMEESSEEEVIPKKSTRGRAVKAEVEQEEAPVKKGRGRGVKAEVVEEEEENIPQRTRSTRLRK